MKKWFYEQQRKTIQGDREDNRTDRELWRDRVLIIGGFVIFVLVAVGNRV